MAHRWVIRYGETVTGKLLGALPVKSMAWSDSVRLRAVGDLRVTVPLNPSTIEQVKAIADGGWMFCLIAEFGDQAIVGGPVVTAKVDRARTEVTLGCGSWPLLLAKRTLIRPGYELTPTDPNASTTYHGSLPHIARLMLLDALSGTAAALPWTIDTPANTGGHERVYEGTDVAKVLERLTQLTEVDGGPDVHFQPRTDPLARTFDVRVRIGEPTLGQPGEDFVWTHGGNMRGWPELDIDHSQRSLRSYVPGLAEPTATDEEGTPPIGVYGDLSGLDPRMPLLEEVDRDHGSTEIPTTVEQQAQAHQRAFAEPVNGWAVELYADRDPQLGVWLPGDTGEFRTGAGDDLWLGGRTERRRLMSVSGSLADTVTVTLSSGPL